MKMKSNPYSYFAALSFWLVLTLCCGSSFAAVDSRHNDAINSKLRNNIHELNDKILQSMKDNDTSVMLDLFIDEMKGPEFIKKTKASYIQFNSLVKDANFTVFNEYHITNKNPGKEDIAISSETADKFKIAVDGKNKETFVSILESKGTLKDAIFVLIYVKQMGQWRLSLFHTSILRVAGKSAMDWLKESEELYAKGQKVPALLRLKQAGPTLRPATFFSYERDQEYVDLVNKIGEEIAKDYKFPLALTEVKGNPEVFSIESDFVQAQIIPVVKYLTKTDLKDAAGLQKEVEAMTPLITARFPGIDVGANHIVYRAFTELPTDAAKTYSSYGLAVKTK